MLARDEISPQDIIEMARQAGCGHESITLDWICPENIEAFAKLVEERTAAKEREACWKIACEYTQLFQSHPCLAAADAIRARGQA
jgi:hypothetical protein